MGSSKGSSTTTVQMTPEQQELLRTQTDALKNVFLPAYANTITGAGQAYQATNPAAQTAAQTAMDVAGQTGQLQQQTGTGALTSGTSGQENMAAYQQGLGQGLTGTGAGGLQSTSAYQQGLGQGLTGTGAGGATSTAAYQQGLGQGLTGAGAGGIGGTAAYQQNLGQGLTGYGAGQLSQLFSPQYKEQQINAALQPATEDVREQMNAQGAMFGGAGGLGSARQALASQNLASLSQARLGNVAAQTAANVEAQRQNAANALLGAGQTATGQAGSLYGQLLGAGQTATGQAGSLYSNLLGAGQGATNAAQSGYGQLLGAGQTASGQAGSLYGNLAGQGQNQLNAANQAAASRIGYAGTPQDVYNKYAQVIFGVPQGSTTPNFQGTQGQTQTGKSSGFSI